MAVVIAIMIVSTTLVLTYSALRYMGRRVCMSTRIGVTTVVTLRRATMHRLHHPGISISRAMIPAITAAMIAIVEITVPRRVPVGKDSVTIISSNSASALLRCNGSSVKRPSACSEAGREIADALIGISLLS